MERRAAILRQAEPRYSFFSRRFGSRFRKMKAPAPVSSISQIHLSGRSPRSATILFIPLSAELNRPGDDWAAFGAEYLARECPDCRSDSIVGHGRRRKQAHDETHDWIGIRRGLCRLCGKTFTFLPSLSPPYGHYSLIARSHALQRYFSENYSLEMAAPLVKDPDRVPVASTLRRWFHALDTCGSEELPLETATMHSHELFPALRRWLQAIGVRDRGQLPRGHFLHILLPLRI